MVDDYLNELGQRDEELTISRSRTSQELADALAWAGEVLWTGGWMLRDPLTEGTALVVQMAGDLGRGACTLYSESRWYAGAAVVRQLVEVHYLLTRFRVEPADAERWLNASTNRIAKSFRPGQMRTAGGFAVGEYRAHCELGGHPNPRARWLLPGHEAPILEPPHLWVDLGQHLGETLEVVAVLAEKCGFEEVLQPRLSSAIDTLTRWRDGDPFAARIVMPDAQPDDEQCGRR